MKTENKKSKLYTRESDLSFSHIKFRKITNKIYTAEFKFSLNNKLYMDTTIKSDNLLNCIQKVEEFLQTELNENEYTIKN